MISRLFDIVHSLIKQRFAIVHIDVYSTRAFWYAEITSLISRARGVPTVLTLHGGMLSEKHNTEPHRVERLLQSATVIQSPSQFLTDYFRQQGIKVNYMPNFIDLERFPYKRDEVKPWSLLWVRAFSVIYQPEMAVQTLASLARDYPEVTLTMIGPDKGKEIATRQLAQKLGVFDRIKFVGRVSNESLYEYYNSHSVFLNTTHYESFGVAVLEAASCGIPIVSTNVGEIPWIWSDNENILLVDNFDSSEMSQKVAILFNSQSVAGSLSENARLKAQSFEWANIKPKWLSVFNKLIHEQIV